MRSHLLVAITLILLSGSSSWAQMHTNYGIRDGLPSNHVYKAVQDLKGFIWILTDNGLVKYNGSTFREFTVRDGLPTNDIWELATTDDGKVWFFCKAAQVGYIENDVVFTFGAVDGATFFPNRFIEIGSTVFFESNHIWYTLYNQNVWKPVSIDSSKGLGKNEQEIHNRFLTFLGEMKSLDMSKVSHLRAKDSLLFWVTKDFYHVRNINTHETITGNTLSGEKKNYSGYARINYAHGQIQITDIHHFALLKKDFSVEDVVDFPSQLGVHHTTTDISGNLWLASFGNGLYQFPGIYSSLRFQLQEKKVTDIIKVQNSIIAGVYDEGYYMATPEHKTFKPHFLKKGYPYAASYLEHLGRVFYAGYPLLREDILTNEGIAAYHRTIHLEQGIKQVAYLDGFFWGLGSLNLKKIDTTTFQVTETLPLIAGNQFFPYKNQLLIATNNGIKSLKDNKISDFYLTNELDERPLKKLIKISEDRFLIITEGFGAYISDLNGFVEQIPKTRFLNIADAFVDEDMLWIASSTGLLHYRWQHRQYLLKAIFSEAQGIPTQKVNGVTVLHDEVFVATDIGIVSFPKSLEVQKQFLDIYFESVRYNNRNLEESIAVPFAQDESLGVKIGFIDYSYSKVDNEYQFRLLPIQKTWQETTSQQINFNQLQPNQYLLEVKKGVFVKTFPFTIQPLWWQRQGIRLLGLVTLLALVTGILFYVRKKELKRRTLKIQQQKKNIEFELNALRSQMNPHFVFNSLSAIQNYINNNETETSEIYLVKFSKLIRRFFELSKKSEITVAEEVKLLRNYLEIEKLRFKEKLEFEIIQDGRIVANKETLPAMLLQPIVENAVTHGIFNKEDNGMVCIHFKRFDEDGICVSIKDDGVGFENTPKRVQKERNSTQVLQERIFYLNQTHEWEVRYERKEAFPNRVNTGNLSLFKIKRLKS